MEKIIIDTDAGIDDSIAILLANAAPNVKICAITTCFGTTTLENTTNNVLNLSSLIGLKTRIAKGAASPLIKENPIPGNFHGETGIGLAKMPETEKKAENTYAWDVLYEEAKKEKGNLTLVTLGPLTNIATAFLKYEDLPKMLKKIVIMGGTVEEGNVSAYAEANIAHDPHACEIVFRSKANIVMAGLNATEKTRLTEAERNYIFSKHTYLWRILRDMFTTYGLSQSMSGEEGLVIHDAAAMFAALYPQSVVCKKFHVVCETASCIMQGRTIADMRLHSEEEKNVDVVLNIDKKAFIEALDNMLDAYK